METVEAEVIENNSVILRPLSHIEDGVDLDALIKKAKALPKVVLGTPTVAEDFKNAKRLHLDFVGARNKIERVRKTYKQPALDYGKDLDKKARELKEKIAPYEDELFLQRRVWEDEEARAKQEALDAENQRVAQIAEGLSFLRSIPLNAFGKSHKELCTIYEDVVASIPEEELFADRLDEAMVIYKNSMAKLMDMIENAEKVEAAEKLIKAAEDKAAVKAEEEAKALKEEREALDKERREFEAEKKASNEAVLKQKAEKDAAALEEKQKEEAVIKAKQQDIVEKQAEAEALFDLENCNDAKEILSAIIGGGIRHVEWRA